MKRLLSPRRLGHCDRARPSTVAHLNDLLDAADEGRDVFIDMSRCENISAEGCIMLAAALSHCREVKGIHVNGRYPRSERAKRTMVRFGFHEHLRFERPRIITPPRPADMLINSDSGRPRNKAAAVEQISNVATNAFGAFFGKKVYAALEEALNNVDVHAFDKDFAAALDKSKGSWWLAAVKHRRGGATFYVVDLGPSVPTVARKKMAEPMTAYWRKFPRSSKGPVPTDREVLEATAEARRAGIRVPDGRGQGFKAMISLIDEWAETGSIQVISGRAIYMLRKSKGAVDSRSRCKRMISRFPGTVIVWKIARPRPATSKARMAA